jgi:hypothetical protein
VSDSKRLVIGPSTGWLYANNIFLLAEQEEFLKKTPANAVETCLSNQREENEKRVSSLIEGETFDSHTFVFRSLHLPDVNGLEPKLQLAVAKKVTICSGAVAAVIHPMKIKGEYPVKYYEEMISFGVPLAIENMDKTKESGFDQTELEKLIASIGCKFVLDVQHAYEHDHEMKYASDLLASMESQLSHLHVSGEIEGNAHSLVHKAANAKAIIEFVGRVLSIKNVPLILEGEYGTFGDVREEIQFLTEELNFL